MKRNARRLLALVAFIVALLTVPLWIKQAVDAVKWLEAHGFTLDWLWDAVNWGEERLIRFWDWIGGVK